MKSLNLYDKNLKNTKKLEIKKIPNPSSDEGYFGYLKSSPNSAGVWEAGSGEEFLLLAPVK